MRSVAIVDGGRTAKKFGAGSIDVGTERRGPDDIYVNVASHERRSAGKAERQGKEQCFFHIICFLFWLILFGKMYCWFRWFGYWAVMV
jgi:hypothetical protein